MARQVAQFVLLLSVLCEAIDQSTTSIDSRCVYTFNVPASECGQTPDSNTDVEVVKSVAVGLQAQIKQLVNEVRQLREDNVKMKEDNVKMKEDNFKMKQQLAAIKPDGASGDGRKATSGGVVYVRWGRKTCPGNVTALYSGVAGGTYNYHKGGGANYQCLPRDPQWGEHTDGIKSGTYIYGAEYQFPTANSPFLKTNFAGNLLNNNVPCAVCHVTERHVKVMIPARTQCPAGWTREYGGYLTTSHHISNYRTTFECMDEAPEVIEGAGGRQGGAWFYTVEGDCGYSLPCPNYVHGWAVTCVVCTK